MLGDAVAFAVDMVNPISDIHDAAELIEEIGTDIIESIYEVELNDGTGSGASGDGGNEDTEEEE